MIEAIIVATITSAATIAVAWVGTRKDVKTLRGIDAQVNQRTDDQPKLSDQIDSIATCVQDIRISQARTEQAVSGLDTRLSLVERKTQ